MFSSIKGLHIVVVVLLIVTLYLPGITSPVSCCQCVFIVLSFCPPEQRSPTHKRNWEVCVKHKTNTTHISRPYPQFPFFSYIKGRDLRFWSHNWILNQSRFTTEKYQKLNQQQWWWCTFSRRCRSEVLNWRTPLPLDVGSSRCAFSKAWYRPVIQSTTNDNSAQIKSISIKTRTHLINQGFLWRNWLEEWNYQHVAPLTRFSTEKRLHDLRRAEIHVQRYATRGRLSSTSFATRNIGAMDESDEGTTSLSKVSVKPVVLVRARGRLTRGELIPSGPPEAAILQFYSSQLCINLVLVKREEFSSSCKQKTLGVSQSVIRADSTANKEHSSPDWFSSCTLFQMLAICCFLAYIAAWKANPTLNMCALSICY